MINEKLLSDNIKKFRHMRGMSQTELGNLLYVSCQTVSKWENGISYPDLENFCALANALKVSADDLLAVEEKEECESFFIGIDGGGTKTEFLLFSHDGTVIKRFLTDGTNPNVYGMEKSCSTLAKGIDELFMYETSISGIFAGIAGSGVGKNKEKIASFLKKRFPVTAVKVDSDIYNVISSVRGIHEGVSVIWGTGINVAAYTKKGMRRFGGWGYLFEDLGGGYSLGNAVLRSCLSCGDKLQQRSLIVEMAEEKLGTSVRDGLDYIYARGKDYIASFAPIAFEACIKGDKVAEKIIDENIAWLAKLINQASASCKGRVKAVISGGLTVYEDILRKYLAKNLGSEIEIVIPSMPQIYGACLACLNMCDKNDAVTDAFEAKFKEGYVNALKGDL